jgi:hypothetical protein
VPPIYHDVVYNDSMDRIDKLNAKVLCMGHTFGWDGVLNEPVRRGPEVVQTLQASRAASAAIDHAAVEALRQLGPDASFAELTEAAFRELVFDLPIKFDRATIFPVTVARAIRAHLNAYGWRTPSETLAGRA